jgi:hypothetical protein
MKLIFSMRSSILQGRGLIDISLGQQAGNGAAAVGAGARLAVGLLSPPMDGESAALSREVAYCRGLLLWEKWLADAALATESCPLPNSLVDSNNSAEFGVACFKTRFWALFGAEKAKARTIGYRIVVATKVEPLSPPSLLS